MREHQHLEWKEMWKDEFLRTICGFANAEGGSLHIGRNNKGIIVGLPDASKLLEEIPNKVRDILGILVAVNLHHEKKLPWLEIVVDPYPNPISYRGHYFQRSGSTIQELKGAALECFLLRRHGRTWDSIPVPRVKLVHLASSVLRRFRDLARDSGRLDPADLRASQSALIEKLQLTEGDYLKRAAVLLFHEDPEKYFIGACVKVGFFRTESDLAYHDMIQGSLFTQAKETIEIILAKYLKAAITYQGIHRIERYPVPRTALREAILNAIVHRDYTNGAPIQIRVYEDRLRIWNPCVLPDGWTVKDLLRTHPSSPLNPCIAHVFFRSGEIETWGRGVEKIFNACKEAGTPKPLLEFDGTGLAIEFQFSSDYMETMKSTLPPANTVSGLESKQQVGEQVGEQVAIILKACSAEPKAKADLLKAAGLASVYMNYQRHLIPLLKQGLIERTLPDKPNSRLQKYRLTAKGRSMRTEV